MSDQALSPLDRDRLDEALALAERSIGVSEPNPRVGCVIGRQDGTIVGRGWTQPIGHNHAEVEALRDAAENGMPTQGSTAWVTLEPCAHFGRTPPCCDALITAGVRRVVAAIGDPHPAVNGKGLDRLRAAGVEVVLAGGEAGTKSRELNVGFFCRQARGRPWVRLKVACTLDGRTATQGGQSKWITSEQARHDGHLWRRRAGAILTGIGTVLADDPRLDVRGIATSVQPLRVVVDRRARLQASARITAPPGKVLVAVGQDAAVQHLAESGVECQRFDETARGLDLLAVLNELAARHVNELHVEAGPKLTGSLLQSSLVDELLIYLAPTLLGPGRALADLPALPSLDWALRFTVVDTARVGPDLRLRVRPLG